MDHIVQLLASGWLDQLEQLVCEFSITHAECQTYALVDMAFSGDCYRALKRARKLSSRCIFDLRDSPDEKLARVSPTLVHLRIDDPASWRPMMRATDGKPMVSLITTPESLYELALRLDPWCVVGADGENYCLRFADTRRLPDIVSVLTPEQHAQLSGPAEVWLYRDRRAQWSALPLPDVSAAPAAEICFDSRQFGILVDSSEADEIIDYLRVTGSSWGQNMPAPNLHSSLCEALRQADRYEIVDRDRIDWCVLCLQAPGLNERPQVKQWLAALKDKKLNVEELFTAIEKEIAKA